MFIVLGDHLESSTGQLTTGQSSQYINKAVCHTEFLRGEDGHTTGTKVASEYRQVQLVCADLFRLTAPFLLAVNACHNGQPWLKGEQQTSWLTGHLFIL